MLSFGLFSVENEKIIVIVLKVKLVEFFVLTEQAEYNTLYSLIHPTSLGLVCVNRMLYD